MYETIKLFMTAGMIIIGWWVVQLLTYRRERQNKRDDKRIEYMISVFEDLNEFRAKANVLEIAEATDFLMRILSKIELYGNQKQIEKMRELASGISDNNCDVSSSWSLIAMLRDDLRNELNLDKMSGSVATFYLKG